MKAPTLTEFLLARIAEDEKAAQHAGDHPDSWGVMANDNYGHLLVQPSRVLAECEAKRRIVERATGYENPEGDTGIEAAFDEADQVCRILATVWGDHRDYRQEWKP